jgi:hypothetical protein
VRGEPLSGDAQTATGTAEAQVALTLGQTPGTDDVTVTVAAPSGPIAVVLHETGSRPTPGRPPRR